MDMGLFDKIWSFLNPFVPQTLDRYFLVRTLEIPTLAICVMVSALQRSSQRQKEYKQDISSYTTY